MNRKFRRAPLGKAIAAMRGAAVERGVIVLRCPDCGKRVFANRHPSTPPKVAMVEVKCGCKTASAEQFACFDLDGKKL